ncbi:serine hydrolase domain-containing protein [Maricaulis parjimensis]|uniref:serine hydrolase domain-containing protein n=1 Tax=Maricaulis parjimensis TaxID=144023 RepID=UPI00193980E5|nr:serine hydrolase domain-containing protein [Maricaulis parjimensis]
MLNSRSQLGAALVAGVFLSSLAGAQTADPRAEAAQALFDAMAGQYPALNATVMVAGEIVWEAEGGMNRLPGDGVNQDYNVYSVAKLMVALAYLRLEQTRGLDLGSDVREIDPDLPAHYDGVTLRQLIDHRAGVRHYTSQADWIAFSERRCDVPADALGHFIQDPLAPPPDGDSRYTTFGYVLLSHLLVRITGAETFDAAMTDVLGEAYTAHRDSEDAAKAVNWVDLGEGLEQVSGLSAECKFGGGGLLASSRDLAALLDQLAAGDLVEISSLANQPGQWAGHDPSAGLHYAAHSGGSPGGRSFMITYAEPRVSVAVTANADGENFYALSVGLANVFAGLED